MKHEYCHLLTPEGENLPTVPWADDYPRPLLKRDSFFCLNGEWEFSADGTNEPTEKITVPFPPESRLSGICRFMGKVPRLYYRKKFSLPDGFVRARVILHFGAVDQYARVIFNGHEFEEHMGGYEAFSFDVTDFLAPENTVEVYARDEYRNCRLPYGKQRAKRGGMWYTPVSGIWQTIWLESVPENYVEGLRIASDMRGATVHADGVSEGEITVSTPTGEMTVRLENGTARIEPPDVRLWSPEDPYLYRFVLRTEEDEVSSYFACREVTCGNVNGCARLLLNGKPYFFHALLDQGYYSDGIFTPAAPVCFENDILAAKSLGFNTLRKHIKLEPERFYYDCDRLGMLVFQDIINNGKYSFLRDTVLPTLGFLEKNDRRLHKNRASRAAHLLGMQFTVWRLASHPSVVYWTIFNEGWGQFDGAAAYERLRNFEGSRVIDTASGWFTGVPSDVVSPHIYFKPVTFTPAEKPTVLSEFGGYSYPVEGHRFNTEKEYGYRKYSDPDAFAEAVEKLYREEILPAARAGLSGAVLTQLSDVEDETNGLLTYDRRVLKLTPERMLPIAQELQDAVKETN